jgi:hypothetical protein
MFRTFLTSSETPWTPTAVGKIEQDYLRRVMLREHDSSRTDPVAPAFIAATARTALDLGYHVVLEGILHTDRYAPVLRQLISGHAGPTYVYYLDVCFDETVRRHRTRAEPIDVTPEQMRDWYATLDLLDVPGERIIPETSTFERTVDTILTISGLANRPPLTPCPNQCPHCAAKTLPDTLPGTGTSSSR